MKYTITGIFAVDTKAEDAMDAKALASQRLKEAGIKSWIIEVIKDAEEKQESPETGTTKAAAQD